MRFNSASTWEQIRNHRPVVSWAKGVWFKYQTPKYSFQVWVSILNRLPTGDRMQSWGQNISPKCVLCNHPCESRDHLFFACPYSTEIWTNLALGLRLPQFTTDWNLLIPQFTHPYQDKLQNFTIRYVFQATLYHIWRERNSRRHGNPSVPPQQMIRILDRIMRNRFHSICALGDVCFH